MAGLVARAAAEAWPITADHCFLRIAYDHATGDRWDGLCARPAWRHLPEAQLAVALAALAAIDRDGLPTLRRLNADSLRWRATGRAGSSGAGMTAPPPRAKPAS